MDRTLVVTAALDLLGREGLDALSMRTLADRLGIKAASLYWHVRDRRELLELVAASILAEVSVPRSGDWRAGAMAICTSLEAVLARRRDSHRVLLEVPGSLERSGAWRALAERLQEAGLSAPEAGSTASMMLLHVVVEAGREVDQAPVAAGRPARIAIDAGSRGVVLRAGGPMEDLFSVPHDPSVASPTIVRGDTVVVRRLRGVGRGEIDLNPAHAWSVKVQAPTWNTLLDLAGLEVGEIHIDSGAVRVECLLPRPHGVVPIHVSSGVVDVRLRRPPGVPVLAEVSTGVVQLRLDAFGSAVTTADLRWESHPSAAVAPDHYLLRLSSGSVKVRLEEDASIPDHAPDLRAAPVRTSAAAALEVVLDGVASRSRVRPG
jgi:TetR/AcrR family transcriptional regulator, tetracycline repressor protein